MSLKQLPQEPWYSEGLHFKCTGCGKCCTGFPGYVWVDEEEIEKMAKHLDLTIDEFAKKYLRQIGDRISLKEYAPTYDCVFFKNKQCTVYQVRPTQCRTYPFWNKNLTSPEIWEQVASDCEGIRDHHPKVSIENIEKNLNGSP